MIYALGARIQIYKETRVFDVHSQTLQLAFWSLISHAALAMAILSALNVIYFFAAKTPKPTTIRRWTIGIAIVACLWLILVRFLDDAMSFDGKMASAYALMLSLALTLWGFSCVRPFLTQRTLESLSTLQGIFTWMIIAALAGACADVTLTDRWRRLERVRRERVGSDLLDRDEPVCLPVAPRPH